MRTLGSTLTEAQESMGDAKCKITLGKPGENAKVYYIDSGTDRILTSSHTEQEWSQTGEVVIQDADTTISQLDLRGWIAYMGYGYGANYSECAPMDVIAQRTDSYGGHVVTTLSMEGVFDMMDRDTAWIAHHPEPDDTDTVKTILQAIVGATMVSFWDAKAYTITFDSEDSLIDSVIPADYFNVARGESRLSAFKKALAFTGCKARAEYAVGEYYGIIHVFVPTVTGTSYDYEYNDAVTDHNFFSKSVRERLVLPNRVEVKSPLGSIPPYFGAASDATSYAALGRYVTQYKQARTVSDAESEGIAEAILAAHRLEQEQGAGLFPMNCGQELFDYIKITDTRANDTRVGNVGYIRREYARGQFPVALRFGSVGVDDLPPLMPRESPRNLEADVNTLYEMTRLLNEWFKALDLKVRTLEFLTTEENLWAVIYQSVFTTWGDVLYRGEEEAERLGPNAGKGYNFLRSRGEGLSPLWEDIEDMIVYISGGGNKMILSDLAIPIPTIALVTVEDHSGGAFTSTDTMPIVVPTIAHSQAAYTTGSVSGAIADDGGAQTNETTEANEATADDMTLLPAVPAINDAYYFGRTTRWDWIHLEISTPGDGVWTFAWEYYDGDSWEALPGLSDTTLAFTQSGSVAFVRPGDWATSTIILEGIYWIRARVSAYTSIVTQPLGQQALIGSH